ncbi:MAG: right-handed parallel beta-helix repeat-containing protein [Burkholderiaceae bacterium]
MDVPWPSLPAGSTVLISPGSYSGITTVTSVGTAAHPIVVTAFNATNPPTLTNSVDFQGAAYLQISHVTVQSPTFAGFVIRRGSHHLVVSDSTINGAPSGINITDAAGIGHQILRNKINNAVSDGINVDVNSDPSTRTLISGNTITGSGQHGIELRGSHYQVERNVVLASGAARTGGVSGIHVYRGNRTEDSGADNLVRYNASTATSDPVAADGNGIQVDQWCNGNTVAYNLVWGNDGAGIIVYDGDNNVIEGNTAVGDGLDPGHTHTASLGELIIGASVAGAATGNQAWNNLLTSTRAGVPGLYIDSRALAGANAIGVNLYANTASGPRVRWGDGLVLSTASLIDSYAGVTGSVIDAPSFVNAALPLAGGLRLAAHPTRPGVVPAAGDLDYAGSPVRAGWYFFGAYFTSP